jgi:glycerophosphoryl diester phosphodiesterase
MKKLVVMGLLFLAARSTRTFAQHAPDRRLEEMFDRSSRNVYVVAHRGDWRDDPENSLRALLDAERMGVDVVELDVKKTSDGQLVVMHDKTLDRTTTGAGAVADHTLAEITRLKLRSGTGHPTAYSVPTFAEELAAAKGHIILDVDQGWDYFPEVLHAVQAMGMTDQVILNALPNTPYEEFVLRNGPVPAGVTLMIVVNMSRPDAEGIIRSYRKHPRTIIQCLFADEQPVSVGRLADYRREFPVWVNSLWPEQNAGHDDDRAVDQEQPDQTWGWLISHSANILQTDRPRELLTYLRRRKVQDRW